MQNVVIAGILQQFLFYTEKKTDLRLWGIREIKILQSSKNNDMIITEQVTCQLKITERVGENV